MAFRWALAESEERDSLFPDERVAERHVGKGVYAGLEFLHVNARTIINSVPQTSLVPFRHTINPYRGCSHACAYCFARPTHDYLGLGIGADFERKIVVKVNAVERLRAELRSPRWGGDHIALGTNTDPYQHAEGKYHLTQGIVETLAEAQNPFSILTKSTLILRDAAALTAASRRTDVSVSFSIGTLDREVWRMTEPGTPPPDRRVAALRRLADTGIPCGVLVAPVLPGLSDSESKLNEVVEACAQAGARWIGSAALHLRGPLREHYLALLARERPDLVELHLDRFRRGAYQPAAQRELVDRIVHEAAVSRGVEGRDRYRARSQADAPPAPSSGFTAGPTPRADTSVAPGSATRVSIPRAPDAGPGGQLRLL